MKSCLTDLGTTDLSNSISNRGSASQPVFRSHAEAPQYLPLPKNQRTNGEEVYTEVLEVIEDNSYLSQCLSYLLQKAISLTLPTAPFYTRILPQIFSASHTKGQNEQYELFYRNSWMWVLNERTRLPPTQAPNDDDDEPCRRGLRKLPRLSEGASHNREPNCRAHATFDERRGPQHEFCRGGYGHRGERVSQKSSPLHRCLIADGHTRMTTKVYDQVHGWEQMDYRSDLIARVSGYGPAETASYLLYTRNELRYIANYR